MRTTRVVSHLGVAPWLVALHLAAPALAQEPSPNTKPSPAQSPEPARRGTRPGDVQKVFVLKHVRADDMAGILSVFPAQISNVERIGLSALAVSAAPAVVAAIEETIKRLDVPPPLAKSVDVTGYVLECSAKGGEAGGPPSELQDVVAQLKRTFNYADCGLGQTLFARGSDHARFETATASGSGSGTYHLQARIEIDGAQGSTVIRFRGLSLQIVGGSGGRFAADVDVRDGQRVVLGKLGSISGKDGILVLTAKVVD
jgi:hypothetical protein